ncbi:MAG TPA: TonB family protein [Bryobacterales bacterium]|nr:TonB family protein [Bryobacterales bacterium]
MSEPPVFALPGSHKNSRVRSFLLSLGIHAVAVAMMIAGHSRLAADPNAHFPRNAERDRKIIWYTRTIDLPPVAPADFSARPRLSSPAPAEHFEPRQSIVASAKNPESRRQMVLQSPPELRLHQDIASPNILAFTPPPAPAPKALFVPPNPATAPVRPRALPQLAAPAIASAAPAPVLPVPIETPRLSLPRFQAPPRAPRRPARSVIGAGAPEVAVAPGPDKTLARIEPQIAVPAPPRPQFILPGPSGQGPALGPHALVAAGAPAIAVALAAPSTVIVGLDPVAKAAPPPPGNRSAQFAAGPVGASGAGSGPSGAPGSNALSASAGAAIRVPNLAIGPAGRAPPELAVAAITRPPLPDRAAKPNRAAFRRELLAQARQPVAWSDAPPLSREPGPALLHGSVVYTMAIDMPNITSSEGSWILHFTELGGSSPDDVLTAPLAMRKVDPKYVAAAAAEGIEGKVLLYGLIRRDGHVDGVRLVQGIDGRLDASAVSAFSKWEFQPATKNGEPVDLEATVQIPFRIGPHRKE